MLQAELIILVVMLSGLIRSHRTHLLPPVLYPFSRSNFVWPVVAKIILFFAYDPVTMFLILLPGGIFHEL